MYGMESQWTLQQKAILKLQRTDWRAVAVAVADAELRLKVSQGHRIDELVGG